jgi:hypothetical protein
MIQINDIVARPLTMVGSKEDLPIRTFATIFEPSAENLLERITRAGVQSY